MGPSPFPKRHESVHGGSAADVLSADGPESDSDPRRLRSSCRAMFVRPPYRDA